MAKVLEFKPRQPNPDESQFASGQAICIQCKHEWHAMAATGVTQLECPNCFTMKGLWKFPFGFKPGTLVRQCNCGNDLFYLTTEGHACANCGIYQSY